MIIMFLTHFAFCNIKHFLWIWVLSSELLLIQEITINLLSIYGRNGKTKENCVLFQLLFPPRLQQCEATWSRCLSQSETGPGKWSPNPDVPPAQEHIDLFRKRPTSLLAAEPEDRSTGQTETFRINSLAELTLSFACHNHKPFPMLIFLQMVNKWLVPVTKAVHILWNIGLFYFLELGGSTDGTSMWLQLVCQCALKVQTLKKRGWMSCEGVLRVR